MAAKKKKAGASARAGATKKKQAKKPARKTRKPVKKAAKKAKSSARKTAKKPVKAGASEIARATKNKKKVPAKKKQIKGEGDYEASRAFLKDQAGFVKKNKAKIPTLGQEAEKALDGPEGEALRAAEAAGLARSRDMF